MLKKTPLTITPRRELPRFGKCKHMKMAPLIDLEQAAQANTPHDVQTKPSSTEDPFENITEPENTKINEIQVQDELDSRNILEFDDLEKPTESPRHTDQSHGWDLKQNSSLELLTPSPLGFASFDTRSIDELITPDEFVSDNLAPGLNNINYDIDLSDFSGDNSIADDVPAKSEPKDPFSPEALKESATFDPFAPCSTQNRPRDPFSPILEPFNQFTLNDKSDNSKTMSFNVVSQSSNDDFFSLVPNPSIVPSNVQFQSTLDPFSSIVNQNVASTSQSKDTVSILDDNDSPTAACLLPSPLQPQNAGDKIS